MNLPPRMGKSLLATIFFPCNPAERFMFASYSATLSTKHSADRRTVITSPWYQERWGAAVKLANDSNQKTEFANTMRGHMIATSVGASATGRGGNFLVADDLINPAQTNSEAERKAAIRWFDETFWTRLDDKRTGRVLVIEQRTHQADATGHLLQQGGWTHLSLPAIAERKIIIIFPISGKRLVREESHLLWPEREGRAELDELKTRLGSVPFAAQYLQAPVSREGNLIKVEWLSTTYRPGELPSSFDSMVMSVDTAYKTGNSNDYSAIVVIGTLRRARDGHAPGHYALDAWRGRVEFGELKRKVVAFQGTWQADSVLVEDAASGQSLVQELRAGTLLPVRPIKPDADKYSRAAGACPILEARRLILPEAAWWREDFIAELISFPNGAFDDWVDALVQALNALRVDSGHERAIAYLKLENARGLLQEGLSIEEAAARPELSTADLRRFVRPWNQLTKELSSSVFAPDIGSEDDPAPGWDRGARSILEAHRAGGSIEINESDYNASYDRG